jgi:putative ABC transport system permease protein
MPQKPYQPLRLSLKLALRQLVTQRSFSLSMILNMALGLTGFMIVDAFNRSFRAEIAERTRQIASADLVVSSRLPWTPNITQTVQTTIPQQSVMSDETTIVSMASTSTISRLVEIRFIDQNYPLYPGLTLETIGKLKAGQAQDLKPGEAWIYRELRSQLGLKPGDQLKIGEINLTVADIVVDDPTTGTTGFSFAPRVYLRSEDLPKTKLLGLGSRSFHTLRIKLPSEFQNSQLDLLVEKIRKSVTPLDGHQSLRVRSHSKASEDLTRLQAYVNDYLSLVALSALFLAAVGTSYLMRGHLRKTVKEFAILSSLGAKPWIAPLVFVLQCFILGIGATLVASIVSSLGLPVLAKLLEPIAGTLRDPGLPMGSVVVTSGFAIASGLLLSLPQLIHLATLRPGFLFQEASSGGESQRNITVLAYAPSVILWWLTAVYESKSWTNGSIFAGVCIGSAIFLALAAIPMLRLGILFSKLERLPWLVSLAIRQMSRNKSAAISTFLALALGTSLINLIPQLKSMITREIARPNSSIPQLFVFDVQDDQVDSVSSFFEAYQAKLSMSPMVRARLESINNTSIEDRTMEFEGEREQQQRESLQARTQNLSFRTKLSAAESIIRGSYPTQPFTGDGLPALSIEEGFARRVGIKLGDKVNFDVMGAPLTGEVTSLRKVRWTSFEPNFMILVQPGVLDDAPKIWVGSISGIGSPDLDRIQSELVKLHSNVSVVDVKSAISKLMSFVDQISVAVGLVAWLALAGGAGVLYAIAYAQAIERFRSVAILKVLGATPKDALRSIMFEYGIISCAAVLFGIILGGVVSWSAATFILKTSWTSLELRSASIGFLVVPICLILTWMATRSVKKSSIVSLLQ